jgi:hypothetical protein
MGNGPSNQAVLQKGPRFMGLSNPLITMGGLGRLCSVAGAIAAHLLSGGHGSVTNARASGFGNGLSNGFSNGGEVLDTGRTGLRPPVLPAAMKTSRGFHGGYLYPIPWRFDF